MSRYLLILAVLLASCNSGVHKNQNPDKKNAAESREKQHVVIFPFIAKPFNYASIEKSNDTLKTTFIRSALPDFKDEFEAYNGEYVDDKLVNALHVFDINGDGRDDLIFEGRSGGEPTEVVFILNTTSGFRVVYKAFQHLRKLDIANGKILRVYINDDGCCAAYIDFNKTYIAKDKNGVSVFKLETITANYHGMLFDGAYFEKPIRFSVVNDHYKLRSGPVVNDTTGYLIPGDPTVFGNKIADLRKNTIGIALASSTDKTGRVWWLVQIPAKYKLDNSVFYEDESKVTADKLGWISSRYIKKLD